MPRRRKIDEKDRSKHTMISYWACWIAFVIEISLGMRYLIISELPADRTFGLLATLEGAFGFACLLTYDVLNGRKFNLFPKKFEKISRNLFFRIIGSIFAIAGVQILFQLTPLAIEEIDRAMAIAFAGVCEEAFYRGVMGSFFILMAKDMPKIRIYTPQPTREGKRIIKAKPPKEISYIEIIGFFITNLLFALIHLNYYEQTNVLLAVFVGGIMLSLIYWWFQDLTAVMLGHFVLNFLIVLQTQFWAFSL